MISTHFREPHHPSERELGFMDLLARQAADYLERKHEPAPLAEVARVLPSVVVAGPNVAATASRAGSDRGV